MSERFKFESVPRPDGLREERVVQPPEENYPMRRAVGMPVFADDKEREAWLRSHDEDTEVVQLSESEILKMSLHNALLDLLRDFDGERSDLEAMAAAYLAQQIQGPGETFQVDVSEDAETMSVQIDSQKYGKIEFKVP